MFGAKQEGRTGAFHGICFALYGFDTLKHEEVRTKLIEEGAVDAGQYCQSATHIIVDDIVYDDPICVTARSDEKILVTALWVYHSLDVGMPVEPSPIMYRPVKDLNGIQAAKNLVMCLTGYLRQDRDDIMTMVGLMGAKFSKPLVANKITHLICYKHEGEKYELAKKIKRIKLVNHQWLEDCLKAWEVLPEEDYSRSGYELEMMNVEAAKDSEEETEEADMRQTRARNVSASSAALPGKVLGSHDYGLPGQPINSFQNGVPSSSLLACNLAPNIEENAHNQTPEVNNSVLMDMQVSNVHDFVGHGDATSPGNQTMKVPSPNKDLSTPASNVKTSACSDSSKFGNLSFSRKTPKRSELFRDVFQSGDGKASSGHGDHLEVHNGAEVSSQAQNTKKGDACASDELGLSGSPSRKRKIGGKLELSPQGSKSPKLGKSGGKCAIQMGPTTSITHSPSPSRFISPMLQLGNQTMEETVSTNQPLSGKKLMMYSDLAVPKTLTSMSLRGKEAENKIASEATTGATPEAVPHVSEVSKSDSKPKGSPQSAPVPCVGTSSTHNKEPEVANSGDLALHSEIRANKTLPRLQKKMVGQKGLGLRKQLSALKSTYQKRHNSVGQAPPPQADTSDCSIRPDGDKPQGEASSPSKANAATLQSGNNGTSTGKSTDDDNFRSHPELMVNKEKLDHTKSLDACNPEMGSPPKADAATLQTSNNDKFADDETEGPSLPEPMENDERSGVIRAVLQDETTVKQPNGIPEKTDQCCTTSEPDASKKKKVGKRKTDAPTKTTIKKPKSSVLVEQGQEPKENVQNSKVEMRGSVRKTPNHKEEKKHDHFGETSEPETLKPKDDAPTKTKKKPTSPVLKVQNSKGNVQNNKEKKEGKKKILNRKEDKNDHCGATSEPETLMQKDDASTKTKKKPKSPVLKAQISKGNGQNSADKKGVKKQILNPTSKTKNGRLPKKSVEAGKENEPVLDHDQSAATVHPRKKGSADSHPNVKQTKPGKKPVKASADYKLQKSDVKVVNQPTRFLLSGHRLQRKEFQKIVKRLNGRLCRDTHQWSYQATHFVVPEPVRRVEKFFAAAASGSWILKIDYLTDSDNAGKFLAEEPYEWHKEGLSDDGAINLECPRKWRLLRERTGHGAFYGMKIVIYGECIAPPLDTLKRAVKAGDGTILATAPPYTRFLNSNEVYFAIVSPGMPRVDAWVQEFIRHEIPCVSADYLVEYVCKPGSSLEKHVLHKTNAYASKSLARLIKQSEEIVIDLEEKEPCTPEAQLARDVSCEVCGCTDRGEVMLICGDESGYRGCGAGTHIDCCDPPLDDIPEDDWFCSRCAEPAEPPRISTKKVTSKSKRKK